MSRNLPHDLRYRVDCYLSACPRLIHDESAQVLRPTEAARITESLSLRAKMAGKCKSGVFRMVGCQLSPHQRAHSAHDLGDRCYWLNPDPTLARLGLK
jgi:hypothetical protein